MEKKSAILYLFSFFSSEEIKNLIQNKTKHLYFIDVFLFFFKSMVSMNTDLKQLAFLHHEQPCNIH